MDTKEGKQQVEREILFCKDLERSQISWGLWIPFLFDITNALESQPIDRTNSAKLSHSNKVRSGGRVVAGKRSSNLAVPWELLGRRVVRERV